MNRYFIIFTVGILIFVSCETQNTTDDKKAVNSVLNTLIEADKNSDLSIVIQQYSNDAILMPPKGISIIGKDNIKKHYAQLFVKITFIELNATSEETLVSNNWAVITGKTSALIKESHSIPPRSNVGKFVMIFKKDSLKSWKIYKLIWNDT